MAGSLAEAGRTLGRDDWVRVAVGEVGRFTPHLLAQGGPENGWLPAPTDRVQIAYGADATLQNLLRTAAAARRPAFADLAGIAGAWYFGNNPAGVAMYDPASGRTFDGINPDRTVNRNSGAESTIHGLLSMLALDAHPAVAARARVAGRRAQVTWRLVEAEAGALTGAAEVVTPAEPGRGRAPGAAAPTCGSVPAAGSPAPSTCRSGAAGGCCPCWTASRSRPARSRPATSSAAPWPAASTTAGPGRRG
jgi:hypothetical protein